MSNPDIPPESHTPVYELRDVGSRIMRVTVLPPEDPEVIKKRDNVVDSTIGSKTMAEYRTVGTSLFWGSDVVYRGYKAPNHLSDT